MKQHSLFCCRQHVIREVQSKINLSTTERDMLVGLGPDVSPCCNCKHETLSRPLDAGERVKAHPSRRVLVDNTIRVVMNRRSLGAGHPSRGLLSEEEAWRKIQEELGLMGKEGEGGEVIRIDFKNRRRII